MSRIRNMKVRKIAIAIIAALLAEIFVFNFRFFGEKISGEQQRMISYNSFSSSASTISGNSGFKISNGSEFYIKNPGSAVNSLKFVTGGTYGFTVNVSYTDNAFSNSEQSAGQWTYSPYVAGSEYVRLKTFGKCGYLKFSFSNVTGTPVINAVILNAPYFHFSVIRFLILLIIIFLIYVCRRAAASDRVVCGEKYNAKLSLWIIFAAAGMLCVFLYYNYETLPFTNNVSASSDLYQLLTEAFSHGHTSLLRTPPEQLLNMSNPYDASARNFGYIFDSAFYNGKYYCYFGITPVITLMLPVKLITGFYMSSSFGCLIYFLVMMAAALMLYYNIVMKWFPETEFLPYSCGAVSVVFGCGFFWLIARPMFYELAETSALAYMFLGYTFALMLLRRHSHKKLLLFLCGLSFALMVASRPTFMFYIVAVLPIILPEIFEHDAGVKKYLARAAVFCAPLIVFAVILMAYNAARFGSPFNFGQKYQLTVSDVRYNKMTRLSLLPAGIYHYFFAPLTLNLTFPFFHVAKTSPDVSAGYYFNFAQAGLFNYPALLILFASPYIIKRMKKFGRQLKYFVSVLLITVLFITYLDIMVAGVLERYMLDIQPALMFVSLILWFTVLDYFKNKGARKPVYLFFCVICIVTAIISTLAVSPGENDVQFLDNPAAYQKLSALLQFWR